MSRNATLLTGWVACWLVSSLVAAQGGAPVSQLAVDVVSLKSGKAVRGAIVSAEASGTLTMAVSRDWLKGANPQLYEATAVSEAAERTQVGEQLQARLKSRLESPPEEPRLAFFLKQELERVERQLAGDAFTDLPQFVWVELNRNMIGRVTRAPPDRQRVAMWAWFERLANVETRSVDDLQRELKDRKIAFGASAPDLADRLPPRVQDDREWLARMALVEYSFTKPLNFQGTGDVLVRADADRKAANLAPILTKVLKSQVDTLLQDLTGEGRPAVPAANPGDWWKSAAEEADRLSIHGLRATRVELKMEGTQAAVQTAFVARLPGGKWEAVWSHLETQDATKPRAEIEGRIAGDPQVKQVLDAVKSFGLGADDQVRQAIRFGAATMAAQQAADARFYEFRDRYLKRLDSPPLVWKSN